MNRIFCAKKPKKGRIPAKNRGGPLPDMRIST